jgi:hypothetical protein
VLFVAFVNCFRFRYDASTQQIGCVARGERMLNVFRCVIQRRQRTSAQE